VPPETIICFLALKVRDCSCLGELVSIMSIYGEEVETYGWVEGFGRNSSNSDCFAVFQDDFVDFGVALEMQVLVD
jgi:hypothetical protein